MQWSPSFEKLLESQPPERLQAQLLWLLQSGEPAETRSPKVRQAIDAVYAMTPPECLRRLERLTAGDLARLALLQEFGANFSRRPAFEAIVRRMTVESR